MLLVLLVVPVTSQSGTFKVTYINDSSPILYSPDTIRRSVDCGVTCTTLSSCFGFMFDNSIKKCVLLGCINPHLFNGSQSSYLLPMSTLLARGEFSYVVAIFFLLFHYDGSLVMWILSTKIIK